MKKLTIILSLLSLMSLNAFAQLNADFDADSTKWFNKTQNISGITVKAKRHKYSRKDNPAVELMRKVIEAKKQSRLENHDYYQYIKYQKMTLAVNDISEKSRTEGAYSKKWIKDQVELCPYNNKYIFPLSVQETVTQRFYRKDPKKIRDIITGEKSSGMNQLFQTGEILNQIMKDYFTDVNIYDDQIRFVQHPFTSPIGKDAIAFYRYYITDTLSYEKDSCIVVHFLPNNQHDFGFRGDLWILKDSSYQVKRCEITLPKGSQVNYVNSLKVIQGFTKLDNGEWVLNIDDMVMELSLLEQSINCIVIRNTRMTEHDFSMIPNNLFRGKTQIQHDMMAKSQDDKFWATYRQVELSQSENSIEAFVKRLQNRKGYKPIMALFRLLTENYIETSKDSKFDIGPVNSMISSNFIDGLRLRAGGQTTGKLNPHLFASGFYAFGLKSHKSYYKGELTYSFNKKENLPTEYPMRNITFSSTYDVNSPVDKFMVNDKDNVFTSLKWTKVDKMMFVNRQQLKLEREEEYGLRTTLSLTTESNDPCGSLIYSTVAKPYEPIRRIRTTEARLEFRYAPGETFVTTKQRRYPVNRDAPIIILSHTTGFKGIFGSDYKYNYTEASIFKRFWLKSWGHLDVTLEGGVQWNQVPFPLLIMPRTNLSVIVQPNTFELINNMEFLNDKYASLILEWDLSGKLFNRVPLLHKLRLREFFAIRTMFGDLSEKNNPTLEANANSELLMNFPETSHIMDSKRPYVEVAFGIHNILSFFHVEYVRRLTYLDLPTTTKQGVRFKFNMKF